MHSKQTKEERGKMSCCGFYFPFFEDMQQSLHRIEKRVACGEGELSVEVEGYRYSEVNHLWNTGLMRWMLLSSSCSTISLSMRDVLMRVILDLLPSGNIS